MARTTSQLRALWAPHCAGPWARVQLFGAGAVTVRASIVDAVLALNACLAAHNYQTRKHDTGAYNCRKITGGTGYSLHAYGTAIDINWQLNPYGTRLVTNMPAAMVAAIKAIRTNSGAQVWRWGGDYSGNKDAMHFEVVCTPADIASGIRGGRPAAVPKPLAPVPLVAARSDRLVAGESLARGEARSALSGRVRLVHQTDGNVVLYDGGRALWATRTHGRPTTKLAMQSDGNLVLYNGATPIWDAKTHGQPGAHLVVQDDGNLVLYRGAVALWASRTAGAAKPAPAPVSHLVRRGETLGSIATRYGTTVQTLVTLNRLGNADMIRVGQSLRVR